MPDSPNIVALGFDFGMKRIGVAIGDTLSNSAKPLTTLAAKDGIPDWQTLNTLIEKWQPNVLVVGIPYNLDNSVQEITWCARKFMHRLHSRFHLPTYPIDERLTTKAAQLELLQRKKSKHGIDSVAASLILQAWLSQYPDISENDQ